MVVVGGVLFTIGGYFWVKWFFNEPSIEKVLITINRILICFSVCYYGLFIFDTINQSLKNILLAPIKKSDFPFVCNWQYLIISVILYIISLIPSLFINRKYKETLDERRKENK